MRLKDIPNGTRFEYKNEVDGTTFIKMDTNSNFIIIDKKTGLKSVKHPVYNEKTESFGMIKLSKKVTVLE